MSSRMVLDQHDQKALLEGKNVVERKGCMVHLVICQREVVCGPKLYEGLGSMAVILENGASSRSWRMGLIWSIDSWMNRMTVYRSAWIGIV
jgi:hypothetical protein